MKYLANLHLNKSVHFSFSSVRLPINQPQQQRISSVLSLEIQRYDIFFIIIEELMIKKVGSSGMGYRQPSLKNLLQNSNAKDSSKELKALFVPERREIFELSYLHNSPHYNQDSSYTQLVKLIQKYNEQTQDIELSKSLTKEISRFNKVKLACMRLIYRELLSIAVMEDWQVKKCDFAGKLKNWYYSLGEHHSFLQGVSFKKRKESIIQRQIEENVRSTYLSNVFDEIGDYMRKQMDYLSQSKKEAFSNLLHEKHKKEPKQINLPLIDLLIYKREDARLRQIREKEYEQHYFKTMLKNKSILRQNSLLKLKNDPNISKLMKKADSQVKSTSTFATQQHFYPTIKRESMFELKPLKTKLDWFKTKQNQNNRLSLSNINGINLINCKIQ